MEKSEQLSFKLNDEQRRMIENRAKLCKVSTSMWLRHIVLQVAKLPNATPIDSRIRIREPNGEFT